MSIEKLFGDLTAAINGHTEALNGHTAAMNAAIATIVAGPQPTQQAARKSAPTAAENDVVTDVKAKPPKSQPAASTAAVASPQSETPAAEPALRRGSPVATPAQASEPLAAPEVTHGDVVKALVALDTAGGRDAALAALKSLGATSAKVGVPGGLKPEQYAEAVAVFTQALADIKAA